MLSIDGECWEVFAREELDEDGGATSPLERGGAEEVEEECPSACAKVEDEGCD